MPVPMLRGYVILLLVAVAVALLVSSNGDPASDKPAVEGRRTILASVQEESADSASSDSETNDALQIDRSPDGHFYAEVSINGTPVHFLIDTGATVVALTRDDARRAGLAISARMDGVVGQGASGEVRGEYVLIDRIDLGNVSAEEMPAIVLDAGQQSLLGQSFLQEFDSVEIKGDKILLR